MLLWCRADSTLEKLSIILPSSLDCSNFSLPTTFLFAFLIHSWENCYFFRVISSKTTIFWILVHFFTLLFQLFYGKNFFICFSHPFMRKLLLFSGQIRAFSLKTIIFWMLIDFSTLLLCTLLCKKFFIYSSHLYMRKLVLFLRTDKGISP